MLFNSMAFAIFLPVVFLLYWICPSKYRYVFLLAVSYYFYMSLDVRYVFLLLFTTVISYLLARSFNISKSLRAKRIELVLGILSLAGVLFLYKYLGFFFEIINTVAQSFAIPIQTPTINLMLPVGISFYTFQTLGYLIDVYKGKYPAEKHFGYYSLFVSFFPQLLSGPIGRGDKLLPQFKEVRLFDSSKAAYGLKLMSVGYFKKLVVANLLVSSVDSVFDNVNSYIGLVYIIVTIMFAIQIYCDFSGYTDIAVGTAMLFGIELTQNFKSPYFSHSIKEFWSRWHISLSTWFRDYLYIPMGGSRVGRFRHALNLMITFLVSGLWHGAGLTFLVWGGLHGLYQIIQNLLFPGKKRGHTASRKGFFGFLSLALTFFLICFAWVFFRAGNLADAWRMISLSFFQINDLNEYLKTAVICLDMTYTHMVYISIPVILLGIYDYASLKTDVISYISSKKIWVRYPIYILFLLVILLFSEKGVSTEFYYFQF
jgi:alginate O-acetyltransferase complex protein AlgI